MRTIIILLALAGIVIATESNLNVTTDRSDGIYTPGKPVILSLASTSVARSDIGYCIKRDGFTQAATGEVIMHEGGGHMETTLDQPGTILVECRVPGATEPVLAGAVFAPERIHAVTDCPTDFDAFWSGEIDALHQVPANPQLTPVVQDEATVLLSTMMMDHVDGSKIRGYVATPRTAGPFPALIIFESAGVKPLNRAQVINRAKQGWLVVNIIAHDLPVDQPESFYAAQQHLKKYTGIGLGDRHTSYFRRMFLACVRAVDYVTERLDWNRTTLVAFGTSQGGFQALAAGGLHRRVTAVMANVPAGCDHPAASQGKAAPWPFWGKMCEQNEKIMAECRYFDAVNFAARIRVPTLISAGLLDTICPPWGVIAAANAIAVPHELVIMPVSDHKGSRGGQKPWTLRSTAWLTALNAGLDPLATTPSTP